MNNNNQIQIVQRGCGWPKAGKIYLNILSDGKKGFYNMPVYSFLLCPPQNFESFGLSKQGMLCQSRGATNKDGKEIFDIFDWIGESGYANPTDWIEEQKKLGFHQLIEKSFPFEKLVPESCYFPVHPRAGIKDTIPYFTRRKVLEDVPVCPKDHPFHIQSPIEFLETNPEICTGLLWNDVIEGEKEKGRKVNRIMPSFQYEAYAAPNNKLAQRENHFPAAFMRIPIGLMAQFLVYEDKEEHTEQQALKELDKLDAKLKRIQIVQL
jgi:hypothetical protein